MLKISHILYTALRARHTDLQPVAQYLRYQTDIYQFFYVGQMAFLAYAPEDLDLSRDLRILRAYPRLRKR